MSPPREVPLFQHENTRSNLQSLFSMAAVSEPARVQLARDLYATGPRIARALLDGTTQEAAHIAAFYAKLRPQSEQGWLQLLRIPAGRTVCAVWPATGLELALGADGSVAERQFPGAAQALARTVLRPDTVFYSVTLVEPGKASGTRFHMVFWDGEAWCMLGPAWRALP